MREQHLRHLAVVLGMAGAILTSVVACTSTSTTELSDAGGDQVATSDIEQGDGAPTYPLAPPPELQIIDEGLPEPEWVVTLLGDDADRISTMAIDVYGSIVFGGATRSETLTMGDIVEPTSMGPDDEPKNDGYVARISSDGVPFWIRTIGTAGGYDEVISVATGEGGIIYAAGVIGSGKTIVFGDEVIDLQGTTFLAAYDTTGAGLWLTSCNLGRPWAITILDDGAIAMTGGIEHGYESCSGESSPTDEKDYADMIVAVFETDGSLRWIGRYGGKLGDTGIGVAPGPSGGVMALTQYRSYDLDFGGGWLTSQNGNDVGLVGLDSQGGHLWSHGHGGDLSEISTIMLGVPLGFVIGGRFEGTDLDFGDGPLSPAGDLDVFLASFSQGGEVQWTRTIGGDREEALIDLAATPQGTLHALVVYKSRWLDLGMGALVNPWPPHPTTALVAMDADGTITGARQWSSYAVATGFQQIEPTPEGALVFGHVWHSTNGPCIIDPSLEGMDGEDVVIAKLPH